MAAFHFSGRSASGCLLKLVNCVTLFTFVVVGYACKEKGGSSHGTNFMEDSELLAIYDREGYDEVYIVSPAGDEVAHYVLIDRDDTVTYDLPEGAVEVRVPLRRTVLDSEVYAGAIEQLASSEMIAAMLDASYITSPGLKKRLEGGSIIDAGQSLQPNVEKIAGLEPDAILISYYDGMQTQGLEKLGVPVIKMYDLQESTPLGRAEWIRLLGRLAGKEEAADSIYEDVKRKYTALTSEGAIKEGESPKVLTEIIYKGTWSVPGGKSYPAALIKDAGGRYFKEGDKAPVTLNLPPEQVLAEGGDADIWLIRYYGSAEDLAGILESDPLYSGVKAYNEGNVYVSDTSTSGLFREFPFHPEYLLEDYRVIFTGDTVTPLRYFRKLETRERK